MLKVDQWSYWERKNYLDGIDYLVVGAGIVGFSAAMALRERHPKSKIIILERGLLPSGASSKNAGFACFGSATEIYSDIQSYGEDLVWSTVEKRWRGLSALRRVHGDKNLRFQQRGSWDLITKKEEEIAKKAINRLDEYNRQLESITGIKNVYSIDKTTQERFGFEGIQTSIYNCLEGQIDTARLNKSMETLCSENDIKILYGVEVLKIQDSEHRVEVETNIGQFRSNSTIICTNGFAKGLIDDLDVEPARAQVLITKPIENLSLEGTFHYQEGFYYFRNIDNRVLLGGGRNLDIRGETTEVMETSSLIMGRLEELLKEVILPGKTFEIDATWAGVMGVGRTKKPIVKKLSSNVACGVRLGGMGVAIGTLVGEELAELF